MGRAVGADARCAQNGRLPGDTDAAHGYAGVAANLATRRGALAGHEALKNVMSLVDDHGQSLNRLLLTVPQAEQHQRRGHATTFATGVANAPGQSSRKLDEPLGVRLGHVQHGLHDRRCTVTHA